MKPKTKSVYVAVALYCRENGKVKLLSILPGQPGFFGGF
jgi:hypothetical protein